MKLKNYFLLIASFIALLTVYSCVPEKEEGESDEDYANSICNSTESFVPTELYIDEERGGTFKAYFRMNLPFPSCAVVQTGLKYTTDGSDPTTSATATIRYLNSINTEFFSSKTYYGGILFYNSYANRSQNTSSCFDENGNVIDNFYAGAVIQPLVNTNSYYIKTLANYEEFKSRASSNYFHQASILVNVEFPSGATNIKYTAFLRDLKTNRYYYTRVYGEGNNIPAVNTTATVMLTPESTPVFNNYILNTRIANKRAINGYLKTNNQTIIDNYNGGTFNPNDWDKVIVTDLTEDTSNNTHSFSAQENNLTDNTTYCYIAFSSSASDLPSGSTNYSNITKITVDSSSPKVTATATGTNNSITVTGTIVQTGSSAITNYSIEVYNLYNYTGLVAQQTFTQPIAAGQTFTHTFNLPSNSLYYIKVKASNSTKTAVAKTQATTVNPVPTITVTANQPTSNDNFTWTATFSGSTTNPTSNTITDYGIQYSRPGNTALGIGARTFNYNSSAVTGNATNFEITKDSISAFPGTHTIKAFAKDSQGQTIYSTVKSFQVN